MKYIMQCLVAILPMILVFGCNSTKQTTISHEQIRVPTKNGKQRRAIRLQFETQLSGSAQLVWEQHVQAESYLRLMKPQAKLRLMKRFPVPDQWHTDSTNRFRLRMYGFIPYGRHYIHWERIDHEKLILQTRESGFLVPTWHNRIALTPINDSTCLIREEVVVRGWFSGVVASYAKGLFRAKHQRLILVAKEHD